MKTVYGACLRYLTNSPGCRLSDEKAFTKIWKLPHGTHIMFSWDYYLDDFCSVITLHVTVQRCSTNINSPILPPHSCERTAKLSFSVTASVVLSQSSHLSCLPNFFALIIDQNGHYFLVNFRVIESCIWFYCF